MTEVSDERPTTTARRVRGGAVHTARERRIPRSVYGDGRRVMPAALYVQREAIVDPNRLAMLERLTLACGNHGSPEEGMCAMEAVAWLTGEPHSDTPECVCPTIATFVRRWNDDLPEEDRTRILRPLLPDMIGTRGNKALADRRAWRVLDWLVRAYTPAWLDLVPVLRPHAATLRALSPATAGSAYAASAAVGEASRAARYAARDAAGAAGAAAWAATKDAAWAATKDAAWYAAWTAAGDAAWAAARDAAWYAAGASARDAAWYAAGAAAAGAIEDVLRPTVTALQKSAAELLHELCAMDVDDLFESAQLAETGGER
jgi:hypothetical protein